MNENEQAVEQAETEQPVASPQVEIDYEKLSSSVAEKLKPAEPEAKPEKAFDEMDWDERDNVLAKQTQDISAQMQNLGLQQQAFMRSGEAEKKVLDLIPEHLRGEASAHVKSYIGQLVTTNSQVIAGGLPDNLADEIAGLSAWKAGKSNNPSFEAKAQIKTDDIPYYDEIKRSLTAAGMNPTHEEIKRRSETWGKTRAS